MTTEAVRAAVERLTRSPDGRYTVVGGGSAGDDVRTVLQALAAAQAEASALREALRPFAVEAGNWFSAVPDEYRPLCTEPDTTTAHPGSETVYSIGDLRFARTLFDDLCEDEGCPHHGTLHVCRARAALSEPKP